MNVSKRRKPSSATNYSMSCRIDIASRKAIDDVETCSRDFHELIERYGRQPSLPDRIDEGRGAGAVALVLAPQIHLAETGPAKSSQATEVLKLEYAASTKNFQTLLRKRSMAVRQIMHRPERAVGEAHTEGSCLVRRGAARHSLHRDPLNGADRGANKKAQQ